ncbi:MAG: peptide-binding protein [Thermodesulfobacteriota bacterium]
MNRLLTVALASVAFFLCVSCGSDQAEAPALPDKEPSPIARVQPRYKPAFGDMMVRGSISDASVLLPALAHDLFTAKIANLVYNGLLKYDKDAQLVADLAERWEISDDKLRIRFYLRNDVRWHDGVPFTAADVEFTYRVYVDPKTPTAYASDFLRIEENGVRVLDDYTVEVTYRKPYAPALASWAKAKILPKHLVEPFQITECPLRTHPVGTGPYCFVKWECGDKIELEANKDYFAGRPYIDRLLIKIIPDPATMFLRLKAGTIDQMTLTPVQFKRQTESPYFKENFKKYHFPAFGFIYLGYNLRIPKFQDKRVRQAITMAIDREGIVKGVLLGMGQVAHSPYKPDTMWYNPNAKKWPYDVKKAKKMLAEAGWKDTDGDGILDKDGEPFAFTIITNQGNEQRKNAAIIIQRDLKKVGIKVDIRVLEWSAFLKNFLGKRRFDAVLCGWSLDVDPDQWELWHSTMVNEHQLNHVGYRNPEVDRLLELGVSSYDPVERKETYDKLQEILAEDQPYTFLWIREELDIIHSRFYGIEPGPMGIDYNFEKWYVPEELRKYSTSVY